MSSSSSSAPAPKQGSIVERDANTAALDLLLHPLVIMNISDHFIRTKMASGSSNPRIIGALIGEQTGRKLEIFNSFELVYTVNEGAVQIATDYLTAKAEQLKQVFPTYDFLGWYSNGSAATEADMEIHKQFLPHNESPLYLLVDTQAASHIRELPISIFESELRLILEQPTMLFTRSQYRVETVEAERISVDHIAHVSSSGGSEGSSLTAHLMGVHNAIKMLSMRIKIIVQFLQATKDGQVPKDHGLLRQIASLCNQLPAIDSNTFNQDFLTEYNDALLVTYLASITKGSSQINELVDKFNTAYDRHSRRHFF